MEKEKDRQYPHRRKSPPLGQESLEQKARPSRRVRVDPQMRQGFVVTVYPPGSFTMIRIPTFRYPRKGKAL